MIRTRLAMGGMIRRELLSRELSRHRGSMSTSQQFPLFARYKSTRPDMNNASLQYSAVKDWFVQLRWKAAHMLTSSLSDTERLELLRRMNLPSTKTDTSKTNEDENDEEDKNRPVSHSIAEAVAAARAQEIKLNQERWEREKDKLYRDAENSARERIESDLLIQKRQIAFEEWKKNVADATAAKEAAKEQPLVAQEIVNTVEAEELHPHPILGPCVLDLGYKRLHVVKAQALAAIPVWEKQRIYRHDRAKTMAVDKLKTLHLGMPGVIGLFEQSDGKLSILDGQHRIGMFTILEGMKKNPSNSFLEQIVVEVYSKPPPAIVDSDDDTSSESITTEQQDSTLAKEIFLEINKAEPVKLVDIPGVVKSKERKILNDAVDQLYDEYPEMFRTSTKCHPPHVNLDNVRDAIFAANVLSRHKMTSTKHLYDWLIEQNTLLEQKYKSNNMESGGHYTAKAFEKAKNSQFYLGLESSWYYN